MLWHEIRSTAASYFVDYDALGDVYQENEDVLSVWILTGRDQSTVLKTMVDDTFTPDSGIKVNIKLVDPTALLGAVVAGNGPDVSREGVQRDILPIVEGSTVPTKYGPVKTDHILFIAAGAFHVAKVTDLIPELQGRFPVRVTLKPLTREDYRRILTQPENALIRQYQALLKVDGVELRFEDSAIEAIAEFAWQANENSENIGARRLHTVLEGILSDVAFNAGGGDAPEVTIVVDAAYAKARLGSECTEKDLHKYIL